MSQNELSSSQVEKCRNPAQANSSKKCSELLASSANSRNLSPDYKAVPEASWNDLGDLTQIEAKKIQSIVDAIDFPLVVVGSAPKSERRNAGTQLPLGKGEGTKSDIDYVIPFFSRAKLERKKFYLFVEEFKDLLKQLPDMDTVFLRKPDTAFPRIWFIPNHGPTFIPTGADNPLLQLKVPIEFRKELLEGEVKPPTDILGF